MNDSNVTQIQINERNFHLPHIVMISKIPKKVTFTKNPDGTTIERKESIVKITNLNKEDYSHIADAVSIDDNCYCVFQNPKEYVQINPSIKFTSNFENYLYDKLKDKLCQSDISQLLNEWIVRRVPCYKRDNQNVSKSHYYYQQIFNKYTMLQKDLDDNLFWIMIMNISQNKLTELLQNQQIENDDCAEQHKSEKSKLEADFKKSKITSIERKEKSKLIHSLKKEADTILTEIWMYPSCYTKLDSKKDEEMETCPALQIYKDHFRVALSCLIDPIKSSMKTIIIKACEYIKPVHERTYMVVHMKIHLFYLILLISLQKIMKMIL